MHRNAALCYIQYPMKNRCEDIGMKCDASIQFLPFTPIFSHSRWRFLSILNQKQDRRKFCF
jgi:hypothetical protein